MWVVAIVQHATLAAGIVTPLTVTVAVPRPDNLSFATPAAARVEVLNVDGAEAIYFTTDGAEPTIAGEDCHVLPAAIGAIDVAVDSPGTSAVVKLISAGGPAVSVRALR